MIFTAISKIPSAYTLPEVPTAALSSPILEDNEVLEPHANALEAY